MYKQAHYEGERLNDYVVYVSVDGGEGKALGPEAMEIYPWLYQKSITAPIIKGKPSPLAAAIARKACATGNARTITIAVYNSGYTIRREGPVSDAQEAHGHRHLRLQRVLIAADPGEYRCHEPGTAYWFAPAPCFDLAVVRILACFAALFYAWHNELYTVIAGLGPMPHEIYSPFIMFKLLNAPLGWGVGRRRDLGWRGRARSSSPSS